MDKQQMLPREVAARLAPLGSTENTSDPDVTLKFFTPWTSWTWYATEGSAEDEDGDIVPFDDPRVTDVRFFGLVDGHECELGYWVLSELLAVQGPGGLTIERDLYWSPKALSLVREEIGR